MTRTSRARKKSGAKERRAALLRKAVVRWIKKQVRRQPRPSPRTRKRAENDRKNWLFT